MWLSCAAAWRSGTARDSRSRTTPNHNSKDSRTMKTLFILNDAPYGTERSYNGLRLAGSLSKVESQEMKVFLIGDAAGCARAGQKVPEGFYNIELMLGRVVRNRGQ